MDVGIERQREAAMAAFAKSWLREWNGIPSRDAETDGD